MGVLFFFFLLPLWPPQIHEHALRFLFAQWQKKTVRVKWLPFRAAQMIMLSSGISKFRWLGGHAVREGRYAKAHSVSSYFFLLLSSHSPVLWTSCLWRRNNGNVFQRVLTQNRANAKSRNERPRGCPLRFGFVLGTVKAVRLLFTWRSRISWGFLFCFFLHRRMTFTALM